MPEAAVREEVRLFDLGHRDARALLASGAPVWVPVNPVEYHGPHLSLHNDRLISIGLARDVHARLGASHPLVLASDLEVGVDPTPGPGTRHTSFADVERAMLETCKALHALGARAVIAITWHGAPLHSLAIERGLAWLRARGARALNPFNAAFRELCRLDGRRFERAFDPVEDRALRDAMIASLRFDFHAGFFETSMALHYAPESVCRDALAAIPPCPPITPDRGVARASRVARTLGRIDLADELAMIAHGLGWHALSPFPGYTGAPHLARAESGAVFAQEIARGYAELIADVLAGRAPAPAPPMRWLRAVTLDGRLQPAPPTTSVWSESDR
jgi:creatinine amidohydrolase